MLHTRLDLDVDHLSLSPLVLCDRLLTLARDADCVGLRGAAEHLLDLASAVLEPAGPVHRGHRARQ